jgi:hypothetical protein
MMKIERHSKAAAVLVGAAGLALVTGGTAYAHWTTIGSGTGEAKATTAVPLTGTPATAPDGLYPGHTVAGTLTISNTNKFAVQITAATFGAPTVHLPGIGTCTATGVSFAATGLPITVPAESTAPLSFDATMSNLSDTGCQNATFRATTTTLTAQSAG